MVARAAMRERLPYLRGRGNSFLKDVTRGLGRGDRTGSVERWAWGEVRVRDVINCGDNVLIAARGDTLFAASRLGVLRESLCYETALHICTTATPQFGGCGKAGRVVGDEGVKR